MSKLRAVIGFFWWTFSHLILELKTISLDSPCPQNESSYCRYPDEIDQEAIVEEFFPTEMHLVHNWFDELRRLVPPGE